VVHVETRYVSEEEERRQALIAQGRVIERKAKAWTDVYRLEADT
jgi:hypothetical protein